MDASPLYDPPFPVNIYKCYKLNLKVVYNYGLVKVGVVDKDNSKS